MATLYRNFRWGFTGEPQEMLFEQGRVIRRSALADESGGNYDPVDLEGKWLMPSFIDEHCHILPTGLDLQKLHLGACGSHEQVLDSLRTRLESVEPGRWLHAVHYDQTRYPGGEHLTRHDLDKISAEVPILLRHVSGHASIANSAALKAARIREDEPDFEGGTFRRDASGRIDGVLLEHAHERVSESAPHPTFDDMVAAILLAGERMSEVGISCASDMMTGRFDLPLELEAYRLAAERGCKIKMRLYMQWGAALGPRGIDAQPLKELNAAMDPDRCRIAGIKIFADGAIGSATAAIYGSYTGEPPSGPVLSRRMQDNFTRGRETAGSLMYSPERLNEMVQLADRAGYQVAIHSIGDHSTDLVMDALEATGNARRHRIEHAMILSDSQIDRIAKLGCHITMQPEFLMRFAHSYLRQLGPERRSRLKRAASVLKAGIRLSLSSDRPIVGGDPRDGIRTITSRPDGYDAGENISLTDAWLGYTSRAADANEDGAAMGSLTEGQAADIQILDTDPLAATS